MNWDSAALVALITGLVQVFKVAGVPVKWSPLLAVVCGILAGVFYSHPTDTVIGIIDGTILGLASVGFYSGPKNIARQMQILRAKNQVKNP